MYILASGAHALLQEMRNKTYNGLFELRFYSNFLHLPFKIVVHTEEGRSFITVMILYI